MNIRDIRIGQIVYFFSKKEHQIKILSGKVCTITRFDLTLRRSKLMIYTEYFSLDYEDVFITKESAIDYLKSEILRLESEGE
jgi:hypothetical protein